MKLDLSRLTFQISEGLLRWRWQLMLLISAIVWFVEVYEHLLNNRDLLSPDFLRESFLFGVMLPVLNGLVLTLLARTRQDKVSAVRDLTQQQNLSIQLNQAKSWDDLLSIIVEFPQNYPAIAGTSLYLADCETDNYELVASWSRAGISPILRPVQFETERCLACYPGTRENGTTIKPCANLSQAETGNVYNGYCLPLIYGEEVAALLIIYYPADMTVVAQEIRVLRGAAPEMAMALEGYRQALKAANQEELATVERRRIARNLHDTLGQNISYLRLKLDQLSGDNALQEISVIRQDLHRMREIADDAYVQVRNTLADLEPISAVELPQALGELANQIGQRAGFEVQVSATGVPFPISTQARRQISFIVRESLNNIEKYARAKHVRLEIEKISGGLQIRICDDGIGFDQSKVSLDGHYGLAIMQERALEIGADLNITSQVGTGTQVTLYLPGDSGELQAQNSLIRNNTN